MVKIGYDAIKISIEELKDINCDFESYYFDNKDYFDICYNYSTEYNITFKEIINKLIYKNSNYFYILTQNDFKNTLIKELGEDRCWLVFNLSFDMLESEYIYINKYDNTKTPINHIKDLIKVFGLKYILDIILKEVL